MDLLGILLCGGAGRRFGGDKLLAGSPPLARRAALNLREGVGPVLAVVPTGASALAEVLAATGCEVLQSDRCSRGMGASLAAAIEASSARAGWIVALGDMPAVSPATIRDVVRAIEEGAAIAAPFDRSGRRGHPVGFSHTLRASLLALDGDTGAREILARHAVTQVVVDDPGIYIDIDTREDLSGA